MPFSHYYGLWKNIPRCLPQIQMGLAGRLLDDDEVLSGECYVGHHLSPGSGAYYLFDYGDEWEHDITVKKVTALDPKVKYPKVLKITEKIPEQYPDYDEEEEDEE